MASDGHTEGLRSAHEPGVGRREGGHARYAQTACPEDVHSQTLTIPLSADDEGNETTRSLGLTVARGTLLVLISPLDGSEEIANPFAPPEEE